MEATTVKAQQSAATRQALLAAARRLFAERGYAGVSVEEVVRAARVTKGALYHHFADKRELFKALVEQVEAEVTGRVVEEAARARTPERALRRGIAALLDAFLDPTVQRIVVIDGRAVFDPQEWQEMNERHSLGLLRGGLEAAMADGAIERMPLEPLSHLLLGAMNDAVCMITNADDPRAARRETGRTLERMLEGLAPRR